MEKLLTVEYGRFGDFNKAWVFSSPGAKFARFSLRKFALSFLVSKYADMHVLEGLQLEPLRCAWANVWFRARLGKRALVMQGRYAHAKQFKMANRELRRLRTYLGRVIRDIRRKTAGDEGLKDVFAEPLGRAIQVRHQRQRQRGPKLYSLPAPEVRCIGTGKAHAPYEVGCKVSVAITNKRAPGGQFVAHIKALPGNPFDGHTLKAVIEDTQRLTGAGHNYRLVLRWHRLLCAWTAAAIRQFEINPQPVPA